MNAIERMLLILGRLVRHSPAIALVTIVVMVVTLPTLSLVFGLLFVAAGGDWSWRLMWTLIIAGGLIGFIFVGAALLKTFGVQYARLKWIALIGSVVMAGVLFRGLSVLPTAGPIWTTILWSGFAAIVVGTILIVLTGTVRAVKPLFVIGVILMTLGFISGAVKWVGEAAAKSSSPRVEATRQSYRFCWVKPPELIGASSVRSWCGGKVRIGTNTEDTLSFTVYDDYGRSYSYSIDRVTNVGRWKNNSGAENGSGVWEELPVARGSNIKVLGRFKDETLPVPAEREVWQQLYIEK